MPHNKNNIEIQLEAMLILHHLKKYKPKQRVKHFLYLQPIITQYFIDNKSEIWLLFLIAHSKR